MAKLQSSTVSCTRGSVLLIGGRTKLGGGLKFEVTTTGGT